MYRYRIGLWENTGFPIYCNTFKENIVLRYFFFYQFIGKYAQAQNLGSDSKDSTY